MRRRFLLAGLCGLPMARLPGCAPEPVPDRRRELLRSWGQHFLLRRYQQFVAALKELLAAALQLSDDATAERLTAAEYAWRDARRAWKQTEIFKFGPAEEEPLRYGPKIDFWPVRPANIEAVLTDTGAIVLDDLGAAAKGLPVVEYLLFSEGALLAFQENPRRHEYLRLVIEDLIQNSQGLLAAWDPESGNYLAELVDAGDTSEMFETLSMALSEVVNRMAFTIENIRADKLEAGIGADGTPQPENLESQYSGRSVLDIMDNLRGIELLYFGDESEQLLALDDYLQHRGYHLGPRLRQALTESRAALRAVDLPLSVAVVDAQAAVHRASDALGKLQRLIQVDVIGALSLSVRFNDNDGD